MREAEFREWLQAGGAQTEAGRNSRVHAVKTIERRLSKLGSPFSTLDDAWEDDRFQQLRERIRQMRQNAREGGEDFRILMPESQKPLNRISNWNSWLAQYGRFLAGEQHGELKDADRIRQYVLEKYIEPAREAGEDTVEVLVSDVNLALGLNQAWPNICQALAGRMFLELAEVSPPERIGADQSSATVFRFQLDKGTANAGDRPFLLFDSQGAAFKPVRNFNRTTRRSAFRVKPAGATNEAAEAIELDTVEEVARAMLIDRRPARIQPVSGGSVNYIAYGKEKLVRYELHPNIAQRIGVPASGQVQSTSADMTDAQVLALFDAADARFRAARESWSEGAIIAFCDLARGVHLAGYDWWVVNKSAHYECRFGRKTPGQKTAFTVLGYVQSSPAWLSLNDDSALSELIGAQQITSETVDELVDVLGKHKAHIEQWTGQQPARPGLWPTAFLNEPNLGVENTAERDERDMAETDATNLILFGPPGTGKTYATAREAVRLCRPDLPDYDAIFADRPEARPELLREFRRLKDAGQIDFVTFHQSYAYEDFVEGLRPPSGDEDEGSTEAQGIRLLVKPGIFRNIVTTADAARTKPQGSGTFEIAKRQVFKMSLGRAGIEDEIYEAAIDGNYIVLGWGGEHDWSDAQFEGKHAWQAIFDRWKEIDPDITGNSANVVQLWRFRASMKEGDLVVVSSGNKHFRAIGEIVGPYHYEPTGVGTYNHRRKVKWLYVPDEPLPVELIYSKPFMMASCYLLKDQALKKDGLERLLGPKSGDERGAPDQFVLIIDEINRANISKVFGELITLLEPDKRLGKREAVKVRLPYSGKEFGVPSNLHIIGTMNTADRSIALLDTALRRRFKFKEVPPQAELLDKAEAATGLPLVRFLRKINDRIEYLLDREHRIGHAYFINCRSPEEVDAAVRNAVIPLLQEYFFEDLSRVAVVLGEPKGGAFLQYRKIDDPFGEGEPRASWTVRSQFDQDAYRRCIEGQKTQDASNDLETPAEAAE